MKKNAITLLAIAFVCQLGTSSLTGCKKTAFDENAIENHDKVLKFLSVILNVPRDKIEIDPSTKEFYIPDTEFRIPISEATEKYDSANVYKMQYEQQQQQ